MVFELEIRTMVLILDALVVSLLWTFGTIADFNNGCTAITGYTREDLLGKSIMDAKIWKVDSEEGTGSTFHFTLKQNNPNE